MSTSVKTRLCHFGVLLLLLLLLMVSYVTLCQGSSYFGPGSSSSSSSHGVLCHFVSRFVLFCYSTCKFDAIWLCVILCQGSSYFVILYVSLMLFGYSYMHYSKDQGQGLRSHVATGTKFSRKS